MCDTHLVPSLDELRRAPEPFDCPECGEPVAAGSEYRHIEGTLDDGTGDRFRYRAHDECHLSAVQDPGDDGCFMYAGVEPIP